ncbi:DNA polymerase I [Agathobaculum sp. Marseille-P7918]|uniref:DNA polymerase I n=1 Tax=Agathobaculum sp. Marseille-P7918 TaxID=2479843 RepID=UPI000F63DE15|nr:DNA polymerase I [Agathobaculum sp. Marseille-P7918]
MKIMVIDGNSILNRAFYGVRQLSNHEGLPTNAVYGFLATLFKLQDDEKPDRTVVCFDVREKTFRHLKFDSYKATRKGMPDELAAQLPVVKDVLDAMGLVRCELAGYEADDLIGTISRRANEHGDQCVVVTGDRDSLQLVGGGTTVRLVTTKMGQTTYESYDTEKFREKYGFDPIYLVDLKALMGDSSDNIPGVPGIGEKTAMQLLHDFGSLDGVYQHLDDPRIKKGARTKLEAGEQSARDSYWLATIDRNAPLELDVENLPEAKMDAQALYDMLTRLEFKNYIKRLNLSGEQAAPRLPETQVQRVTQAAEAFALLDALTASDRVFAVLSETLRAVCLLDGETASVLFADDFAENEWDDLLRRLFDGSIELVLHDAKPVAAALLARGISPDGIRFDTCIAAYVIDPTQSGYDLPRVALAYCNTELPALDLDDPAAVSPLGGQDATAAACAQHAAAIRAIYTETAEQIEQLGMRKLYYEIELPLLRVLAEMEVLGCAVEPEALRAFGDKLDARIRELTQQIYHDADGEFNINSPKQLGEVLFEKLHLSAPKKTKTGYSTSAEVLERIAEDHPIVPRILEYRQLSKLKSTYVEGLLKVISPKDGRIHTHFQQTVTATGRLSSTDPNLQNIPVRTELGRELRRMFVAPDDDHVLIDADYSQIELRVLAHISQDAHMIEAFRSGQDIHAATAAKVYHVPLEEVTPQMRSSCKAVNFGIVYGISDFSLAQDIGVTRKEAGEFIRTYLATYPGVAKYMDDIKESAKENGYVTTLFGRRRALPELKSRNFNIRSFGERVAMNTPIQGTAADIIKIAMVRVRDRLLREGLESRLILQVHDELILEAPKNEQETAMRLLREEMEAAFPMDAPLVAEAKAGHSWYDTK